MQPTENLELTVVLPCLNEAETLASSIQAANQGMDACGIKGEVIVADNGSTDGSQVIAINSGAQLSHASKKGYGATLLAGFNEVQGKFVVMADSDGSYDLLEIPKFLKELREGSEFVIGTRFRRAGGKVHSGAMPFLHYWLGTPVLSWLAWLFFGSHITDINCGMRGFRSDSLRRMDLRMTGMEIASEMVIKACLMKMKMKEVPITLRRSGRSRPPHLSTWKDGWRHLRMMLLFSPRWLFAVPGLILMTIGIVGLTTLAWGPIQVASVTFNINTMLIASLILILGSQLILLGVFAKSFVVAEGMLPGSRLDQVGGILRVELGIAIGSALVLAGLGLIVWALIQWQETGFGVLLTLATTRAIVFGITLFVLGVQIASAGFFLGVLALRRHHNAVDRF